MRFIDASRYTDRHVSNMAYLLDKKTTITQLMSHLCVRIEFNSKYEPLLLLVSQTTRNMPEEDLLPFFFNFPSSLKNQAFCPTLFRSPPFFKRVSLQGGQRKVHAQVLFGDCNYSNKIDSFKGCNRNHPCRIFFMKLQLINKPSRPTQNLERKRVK